MHPLRVLDPEPSVRQIARDLYEGTRDLPLICPHGHVDPALPAKGCCLTIDIDTLFHRAW